MSSLDDTMASALEEQAESDHAQEDVQKDVEEEVLGDRMFATDHPVIMELSKAHYEAALEAFGGKTYGDNIVENFLNSIKAEVRQEGGRGATGS